MLVAVADALRESSVPTTSRTAAAGTSSPSILPDAGRIEGEALYARVQATLRRRPTPPPDASASRPASPS